MDATDIAQVAERITRLEGENRQMRRTVVRLKMAAMALVVVFAIPIAMGSFQGPAALVGSSLVITDPQNPNVSRVTIGVNPQSGEAYVLIEDAKGNDHIKISSDWKGEKDLFQVFDINGAQRVGIGAAENVAGVFVDGKKIQ
jgi:hypothetical protein